MKTFELRLTALLDPTWFNSVKSGQHAAAVDDAGNVLLNGVPLRFAGERLPNRTAVAAWLASHGQFVCATAAAVAEDLVQKQREAEERARLERERRNALRTEDEAFNGRIHLPCLWDVGIKDVLSGLSETSWGDGRNKSTVNHVLLLETLGVGRLRRAPGDFLCTAASGTNGKRWSGKAAERGVDGEGNLYRPRVTCKSCLALAARWITEQ